MTQIDQQQRPLTRRELALLRVVQEAGEAGATTYDLRFSPELRFGRRLITRVAQWGYLRWRKDPLRWYGSTLTLWLTEQGEAALSEAEPENE